MPLSDGVERLLEGLDVEQHDAATKDVGPLCVVAGAGAGKTRTLVARAAYGVEAFGLVPEEVLAISFTNKACGEIAERIREVIGPGGAGIGVRTFHAAAWQMLVSPNRERLGRRSSVSILDGESSKRLCKRAIEDVGRVARGYTPREAQRQIALHKAHLRTPAEIAKTGEAGEVLAWIWLRYKALCRAMSAFDFEDMLAAACHLLEDDDAIRERIQSQVRLLLLDEYQDASPSQRRFARLLSGGEGRNVTGIGDDDQTLYAFRGGDATGLIRFEEDYPGAQSVVLTANYRSLGAIVDAGQKLVTRNAERRRKVLRSALGVGGEITTHVYEDEEEECAAVADELATAALLGEAGEVAALARTAYHLKRIERTLATREVPFRVLGAPRALEGAEVQDALAYLQLAHNPHNELAAGRCGAREPGVGEAALRNAKAHAEARSCDLVSAFDDAVSVPGIGRSQRRGLLAIAEKARSISKRAERGELVEAVRRAVQASGWPAEISVEEPSEADRRRSNLAVLEHLAESEQAGGGDLEGLLSRVQLGAAGPQDQDDDVVTLATVHQAKGLEWRRVHLVGASEGTLPHHRATVSEDPSELEAERRVAYVAITRAREELRVSGSEQVRGRPAGLSRFCAEAGIVASILLLAFWVSVRGDVYPANHAKSEEVAIARSHSGPGR